MTTRPDGSGLPAGVPGNVRGAHDWAALAPNRLRAGDPQNRKLASEFLEIAVGRDERGLIQGS